MPSLQDDPLRDAARIFNYVETALWPAMGIVFLIIAARRQAATRRDCLIAGATLLVFGVSDYFEAENGNEWWRPWGLFLWKTGCVLILVLLLINAFHRQRQAATRRP
ncbi:MAG TPA: hypothetical protein VGL59_00010 [Polyangia bacterium]